jgi:hypothetical protein
MAMSDVGAVWQQWRKVGQSVFDAFPCKEPEDGLPLVKLVKSIDKDGGSLDTIHPDAWHVEKLFRGKNWSAAVASLLLPQDYSSIYYWLTGEAKAFYLPAFLLVSIFESERLTDISSYTFDCLIRPTRFDLLQIIGSEISNPPSEQQLEDFKRFSAALSTEQRDVIAAFLDYKAMANEHSGRPVAEFVRALHEAANLWRSG